MTITKAESRVVRFDSPDLIDMGSKEPRRSEFVILELETDEGIRGIGLTFFGGPLNRVQKETIDALAAMIIGEDPMHVEALSSKLLRATGAGPGGMVMLAVSAIDIALWDIKG